LRPSDGTEFDGQLAFIGPTLCAGAIPQQNLGPVGSCWLVFGDEFFLGGWYILGRKLGSLQILEGYSHQLQILNGKKRMGETLIEIWISCL